MIRWDIVAALWLFLSPAMADISVQDDRGRAVVLHAPAQRIISLAPHVTEWLFSLGVGDRVVGAVAYSDYPEQAKKIPRIGDYARLDFERIVALKPDLVVAWQSGNSAADIDKLQRMGVQVYVSEPRTLESIADHLQRLGRLTGTERNAGQVSSDFLQKIGMLRRRYQAQSSVSVFYQIADEPLMTVNGDHIISAVIHLCGGRNVFGGLRVLAPAISREAVMAENPQAIIVASDGDNERIFREWRRWGTMSAVRDDSLFVVSPDVMHRPTLRLVEGASQVCAALENVRGRRHADRH